MYANATDPTPGSNLPRTLEWHGNHAGTLRLLDQTRLPTDVRIIDCRTVEDVWEAIKMLRVRGAPAIGVAAAYGLCLGLQPHRAATLPVFRAKVREVAEYLCGARPTAVNLAWAVARVSRVADREDLATATAAHDALLEAAHVLAAEDVDVCRRIGEVGARLVPDGGGVLTHCNAGALATVAHGTALSVLYAAWRAGRRFRVYADETRPLLQGARLTAYELAASGLDVTVICDNMAAALMRAGRVQMVVVGADRIAANGDTANKIGTYGVAVAARHHGIPLYVAAPLSTIDLATPDGAAIPIEERSEDEGGAGFGAATVPAGVRCWNPAFDVTPAGLIRGIITEKGLLEPVSEGGIRAFFG